MATNDGRWPWCSRLRAGLSCTALVTMASVASAQDAVLQLQRLVDEELLLRPAELGIVQVVDFSDGTRWTRLYLLFDDLRPRPRKVAAELGWKADELVQFLISRNFKDIRVCRRDVVEGC